MRFTYPFAFRERRKGIDSSIFFVITQDGDIIYETFDENTVREIEKLITKTQQVLNCHTKPPFEKTKMMDTINLARGTYFKIFESLNIVLLCRFSGMFGYEFLTCQKTKGIYNTTNFYREQIFYNIQDAQRSFASRSGLELNDIFNNIELSLLLACLTRACLDNDIEDENEIRCLITKIEATLPPKQEFTPKLFFSMEKA